MPISLAAFKRWLQRREYVSEGTRLRLLAEGEAEAEADAKAEAEAEAEADAKAQESRAGAISPTTE